MIVDNEYIEKGGSEGIDKPTKKKHAANKKPRKKKKKSSAFGQFLDKIDRKKVKSTLGVISILFAIYIVLACFSYLFTWKVDQDRIMDKGFFEFLFDGNEEPVANWLGKFGAWISHLLIYKWFGIASFGFVLVLFVVGIKFLFNHTLLPIGKTVAVSALSIVWLSMFLGYFSSTVNYLGGTFGFQINEWLALTLGSFGSIILISCIGYMFALILFNVTFAKIIAFFRKDEVEKTEEATQDSLSGILSEEDLEVGNTLGEDETSQDEVSERVHFMEDQEEEEPESEIIDLPQDVKDELEITVPVEEDTIEEDEDFSVTVAEAPEEDEELSKSEMNDIQKEYGDYDPKLDLSSYKLPPIDLLRDFGKTAIGTVDKAELEANKNKIVTTLQDYKIEIKRIMATVGPTVTLYEIVPAAGVRISKIKNLEDDIALSLAALGIRIIAPIPGKGTIGIEVPNSKPEMVSMRSLIASKKFQESDFELPVVMGKTITNETYTFDLTKMPHLLVAGATGQGKSVGLNAILVSILYKKHPAQVKFVLVDPKKVELTLYNKIERHFLAKLPGEEDAIITDTSKVVNTMNSLCIEMDERYELLKQAQVRTIKEYNVKFIARKLNPENGHRYLPYIVVLIDEFADLIMTAGKEIEQPIARIAQLARAIGIHLIVATQRPSVNVITGMIKANFPARIAFRVLSKIDSRTILDGSGADQLIGRGDMLVSNGQETVRLQCGFVDTPEVEEICAFIGDQRGYPDALLLPEYVGEAAENAGEVANDDLDALFPDAARIVVMHQQGSASLLQRKLKLGYNRAGRIVDQLEGAGIIGPFKGSKARDVLYADENTLEEYLNSKGLI
ncbi:DNA translocase FtsK [Crocinitomicaceae bacterium]|nr:DNA translocase FtsK [Crocinitomicaceae bacterium]MDC0099450.1 DNA translocase FtsK [Crocinitomicaceae bacterium]MDC1196087.1 DNA translocase FtsK [Crocinitomicaceae bacterium]MDC1385608.1 DNA translocase FtsK [Crocinitomicaceae bacterium]